MNPSDISQFVGSNFGVNGGLWSNIIASILLGVLAFLWGRAFERREITHRERLHHEAMALHKQHHKEMMAHVGKIHKHLKIGE